MDVGLLSRLDAIGRRYSTRGAARTGPSHRNGALERERCDHVSVRQQFLPAHSRRYCWDSIFVRSTDGIAFANSDANAAAEPDPNSNDNSAATDTDSNSHHNASDAYAHSDPNRHAVSVANSLRLAHSFYAVPSIGHRFTP